MRCRDTVRNTVLPSFDKIGSNGMKIPGSPYYILLLLVLSGGNIFLPAPAFSQDGKNIEFKDQGSVVRTLSLTELSNMTDSVPLKVFETHEKRERTYHAYPARPLLNAIFGKRWEQSEEIVFTSIDGYQPSIPVSKFLSHDAYFAFASYDGTPFTLINVLQNDELVELGPLYLVWDNLRSKSLLNDGASGMPYQVIGIETTTFSTRYPNLSPAEKVSPQVKRGFLHFRKHCLACHTINGEGGGKAPELNYPNSVVEYFKPDYLVRWIEDPASIRYNTTMPALAKETPNRARVIQEIIAYLKAMSAAKHDPKRMP
ncbi:MAG: c-type cytochrome [Nitrosomonadaceae bacterium]